MAGSLLRILERGSIAVLVAASLLQVFTGVANIAQWYVFGFGFTAVHWSLAWVSIGALAVHIAVKLPAIREAFVSPVAETSPAGGGAPADVVAHAAAVERRWFIRGALGVAAGAVLLTVARRSDRWNRWRCWRNAIRPRLPRRSRSTGPPTPPESQPAWPRTSGG